jgi:hypothetical protein
LPGKTPHEARQAFLLPMQRALSCITYARLYVPRGKQPGETEALGLSEDPIRLRSARIGTVLFALGHQFKVVQDGRTSWHVSTLWYRYHLTDEHGRELLAWHWHPATSPHPHLHISAGPIDRRIHVPTGRVSLESVIRLLLGDLEVPATRERAGDYAQVLDECEAPFIEHRRWHAWRRL